jgi:hypothetical protein
MKKGFFMKHSAIIFFCSFSMFGRQFNAHGCCQCFFSCCSRTVSPLINERVGKSSYLHRAAGQGRLDLVKRFIADEANDLNLLDEKGMTPLHHAVFGGHVDVINALLDAGANPNVQAEHGITPLHLAAACIQYAVCEALLLHSSNPADAALKNKSELTASEIARSKSGFQLTTLVLMQQKEQEQVVIGPMQTSQDVKH